MRLAGIALFCVVALGAAAQSESRQASEIDFEHTDWIASVMSSISTIKVGMTRADLMILFTTEGGLEFFSATTSERKYVYRQCPYIKVDVKLAIASPDQELPTDKIIAISRPYLELSIMD